MSKKMAGRPAHCNSTMPSGAMNAPNAEAASGSLDHVLIRLKRMFQLCLVLLCLAVGASFLLFLSFVPFSELSVIRIPLVISPMVLTVLLIPALYLFGLRLFRLFSARDRELEELKGQLYHAHKVVSVGTLAGEVVHEINNPLAIIDSQSGLIRDMLDPNLGLDASPEALRRELDEIDSALRRARGITHKILSFVRKSEPKIVECDIAQLLDDVVEGIKCKEFEVAGIRVVKDYAADVPRLFLDPDLMQQVFLNLLNNAGDAVVKDGTITLRTETQGSCVRVTIADTGKGMTPEELRQSFKPFFTTKKAGKGTGLGLPISSNIVKGFGGKIEVESTPDVGTAFTVVLQAP